MEAEARAEEEAFEEPPLLEGDEEWSEELLEAEDEADLETSAPEARRLCRGQCRGRPRGRGTGAGALALSTAPSTGMWARSRNPRSERTFRPRVTARAVDSGRIGWGFHPAYLRT